MGTVHASSPSPLAISPVFTAGLVHGDNGLKPAVLYRGFYLSEPSKMLARLLDSAERGDWFAPRAAELATELQDAITVAEAYHDHIEQRSAA